MSSPKRSQKRALHEPNDVFKERRKKRNEEKLLKKLKKEEEKKLQEVTPPEPVEIFTKKNISTISIAVPSSILDNAQSPELRTYLAGQIARAACIYKVDEVIVFDDQGEVTDGEKHKLRKDDVLGVRRASCIQLARILQYLECPQYLRKFFFPIHADLRYAGILNPLDAPHHLRRDDKSVFREGVVTNKPTKIGRGSMVNIGFGAEVHVDKVLTPGLRVTVKIPEEQTSQKRIKAFVVPPDVPRSETGIYWGYNVRMASHLSEVITQCPYKDGYDLTIGTSDKGASIDKLEKKLKYHHALIVFGGLSGLEAALDLDPELDVDDASLVFHKYLNTCPEQGSRTIRTEEAVLVSLAALRTKMVPVNPPVENTQFTSLSTDSHTEVTNNS